MPPYLDRIPLTLRLASLQSSALLITPHIEGALAYIMLTAQISNGYTLFGLF